METKSLDSQLLITNFIIFFKILFSFPIFFGRIEFLINNSSMFDSIETNKSSKDSIKN